MGKPVAVPATLAVRWAPGEGEDRQVVRIKKRWWPWPTDAVTFGRTIYTNLDTLKAGHVRHELRHVQQYRERGWAWVFLHPTERERDAALVHWAGYPAYRCL